MYKAISKKNIKSYILALEKTLYDLEKQNQEYQKENDKNSVLIYDLKEAYEREAEFRGMIKAALHILNNC